MMAMQLIMGLFMLIAFAFGNDIATKLVFFMTLFTVMICFTLITDFTSVLIDTRDNLNILPKPVNDSTFVTSRLLHIAIRIFFIALPLAAPGCIAVAIIRGPLIIPPFILMILLMTMLNIFVVNAVYLIILKITTPAKFQNIIGHIQVIFMIIFMASTHAMPRIFRLMKQNNDTVHNININEIPFAQFIPSFWFADACMMLSGAGYTHSSLISLTLAIFVPPISLWLVVKFLAPLFNQKLGMLIGGIAKQGNTNKTYRTIEMSGKNSFLQHVAIWTTNPGLERAGFIFTARMIFKSRDFQLRVAPFFGIVVFPIFYIVYGLISVGASQTTDREFLLVLLTIIYSFVLPICPAFMQVVHSDKFKASWVFSITPLENPGVIISGATKSMIVIFIGSFAVPLIIIGAVFQGFPALPNLILAGVNLLAISSFLAYRYFWKLPFSEAPNEGGFKSDILFIMLLYITIAIIIGIQYLLSEHPWIVCIWIILSTIAANSILRKIKNQNLWKANKLFPSIQ